MITRDQVKRSGQSVLTQTVTTLLIVLPAAAGVYKAAEAVGMPLPKLAFQSVVDEQLENERRRAHRNIYLVGESVMERIQRELDTAQAAVDGYKSRGERVPDFLRFQETVLELQLEELKRALQDSRRASEGQ